jgi:hypothetical protein
MSYYEKNKEKIKKKNKEYYEKNKDAIIKRNAPYLEEYQRVNKKKIREYYKQYYRNKKEEQLKLKREKFFKKDTFKKSVAKGVEEATPLVEPNGGHRGLP